VIYRGDAADIYQITGANKMEVGEYITVYDPDFGFDEKVQIVETRKQDVMGAPGELKLELSNKARRFPDYGSLAWRDEATEDNLASGSVGGGAGGALASGGTGTDALANEAVSWDKVQFKTDDGYFEQTLLKINAIATFENDFTEIDKLADGTDYAKMRKQWRSASDVTKIAGGEIYTDTVILDSVDFSPTASKSIVGQINIHDDGLTIQGKTIELNGDTTVEGDFEVAQGNIIVNEDIQMDESGVNAITGAEFVGGSGGTRWTFFSGSIQPNEKLTMGGYSIENPGLVDGVDVANHADSSSPHHTKYTDNNAVNAIEDEVSGSANISGWSEGERNFIRRDDLDGPYNVVCEDSFGDQFTITAYLSTSDGEYIGYISH